MAETLQRARKLARLQSFLRVRSKVVIAGLVGGGTIIAFPAGSAVVAAYIAVALGAIAMMAWTGAVAFASIAVAVLIIPVTTIVAVYGVMAAVRRIMRIASPPALDDSARQRSTADGVNESTVAQQSLDNWETDGGPAALPRRRVVKRRVRRFDRHRIFVQPATSGRKPYHVEPR